MALPHVRVGVVAVPLGLESELALLGTLQVCVPANGELKYCCCSLQSTAAALMELQVVVLPETHAQYRNIMTKNAIPCCIQCSPVRTCLPDQLRLFSNQHFLRHLKTIFILFTFCSGEQNTFLACGLEIENAFVHLSLPKTTEYLMLGHFILLQKRYQMHRIFLPFC